MLAAGHRELIGMSRAAFVEQLCEAHWDPIIVASAGPQDERGMPVPSMRDRDLRQQGAGGDPQSRLAAAWYYQLY